MAEPGPPATRDDGSSAVPSEFATRVVSALVMAVVALTLDWISVWSFAFLVVVGASAGCWEWGRLVRGRAFDVAFFIHAGAVATAAILVAFGKPLFGFAVLGAGALALAIIEKPGNNVRWSLFGMAYIGLPAMSLVYLRTDDTFGWHVIVLLFTVVWITDSAAYVAGRNLQGPKLWPSVSPKKTWSGCIAGLIAGGVVGACWGLVMATSPILPMVLVAVGLAFVSEIGDLAESATKRAFDHKDMSNLIPGHGGILDRVDSLIFASVAAALLALVRDPNAPGAALMVWP